MVKVGKWIAKHRILMLIIGFLLIIPSVIGMAATKVNYDLLSYLPEHLETVKGQDILVDEYGMGAFSMVVVENMEMKDVRRYDRCCYRYQKRSIKRAAGLRCHRRSFEPRCHRADIDFLRCSDPVPVKYRTCNPLQPGKQRVPW